MIALLLVLAAAGLGLVVRPYVVVERAVAAVPQPADGSVTEEIRRRTDGCLGVVCPQRIRVYTVSVPGSVLCDRYARLLPSDARILDIGTEGFARCGWTFDDGPVLVGVVVEEPPGVTELVISARLSPPTGP